MPRAWDFDILPGHLLSGQGCSKCRYIKSAKGIRRDLKDVIDLAKKVHGDKYDYSLITEYKNDRIKYPIICPEHGVFYQAFNNHIKGKQGCPECGKIKCAQSRTLSFEEFVSKANNVHNFIYTYDNNGYVNTDSYINIYCKEHGLFRQQVKNHLIGQRCPLCFREKSTAERKILDLCKSIVGDDNVICNDRTILHGKELDIYIPSMKIAIEIDGLIWHSEKFNYDKNYHLNKTEECEKQGIRLIQIFEDEYLHHKEIVLHKLKHLLGKNNQNSIMARKCAIVETNVQIAKDFLNKHHIQGFANGTVHLACMYNELIIGIMSFKKEKKDTNNWELVRFATHSDFKCNGVGGKLFKYFVRKYNPNEIKSFADRRWTINENNNLYIQLGFIFHGYTPPDYKYVLTNSIQRMHKFGFRKQILHKKYGFPLTMTENEMTKELKLYKIYDCGLIKYIWKNQK